jgi:hypothetical protein
LEPLVFVEVEICFDALVGVGTIPPYLDERTRASTGKNDEQQH